MTSNEAHDIRLRLAIRRHFQRRRLRRLHLIARCWAMTPHRK